MKSSEISVYLKSETKSEILFLLRIKKSEKSIIEDFSHIY